MADQSTDLGRVKVLSVSITLPKAQKVTWAIASPNQQDPILTTSSDALAKQTSQLWGNTGYSFPLSVTELDNFTLNFALSTKSSGFEKKKGLIGEAIIDLGSLSASHARPTSFEAVLGPGFQVTITFILQGASLLSSTLLHTDLDLSLSALKDVKSLFSDSNLFGLAHQSLASGSLISALLEITSSALNSSKSTCPSELSDLLDEVWHKIFEVPVFSRFGQHFPDAPNALLGMIATKTKSMMRGNMALKTALLDALKQITALRPGIALMPQFCELLGKIATFLAKIEAKNKEKALKALERQVQRFIGVLIRILASYDPKYIEWLTVKGEVVAHAHKLLLLWNMLEPELLKQIMELLKFIGTTHRSKLDEFELKLIISTISVSAEDIPLRLSVLKASQQLWPETQDESTTSSLISTFRESRNPVHRLALFDSISRQLDSMNTEKQKLDALLEWLVPIDLSDCNFAPTDIAVLLDAMHSFKPAYEDLLNTNFFKTITVLLGIPSYPPTLIYELMEYWFSVRPGAIPKKDSDVSFNLRQIQNRQELCVDLIYCITEAGWQLGKPKKLMDRLLEVEASQLRKESVLLLDSNFFSLFLPFWFDASFARYQRFLLRILWHQPDTLAKLLQTTPDFLDLLIARFFASSKSPSPTNVAEINLVMTLMAMKYEVLSDDDCHPLVDSEWTAPWSSSEEPNAPALPSAGSANTTSKNASENEASLVSRPPLRLSEGSLAQIIRTFDVPSLPLGQISPKGADMDVGLCSVLAHLLYEAIMKVYELSLRYSLADLQNAPLGSDLGHAFANWKLMNAFITKVYRCLMFTINSSTVKAIVSTNIIALVDFRWKTEFFETIFDDIFTFDPFQSSGTLFNLPIYLNIELYPHDPFATSTQENYRIGLGVALRNYLQIVTYLLRKVVGKPAIAWVSARLSFLAMILLNLQKYHGAVCIKQLGVLWSLILDILGHYRHPALTLLSQAILEQLGATSTEPDPAVMDCDRTNFFPPKVVFALLESSFNQSANSYTIDPVENYNTLTKIMRNWPKIRFHLFCNSSAVENTTLRYRQELGSISMQFSSMTVEELENNWDVISELLDYYYIPHLFTTQNLSLDTYIHSILSKTLSNSRNYLSASDRRQHDAILLALIELALDILIMCPLVKDPQRAAQYDALMPYLYALPSESITKKAMWVARRAIFAYQTSNTYFPAAQMTLNVWSAFSKHPSCITMLGKMFSATTSHIIANPAFETHRLGQLRPNLQNVCALFNIILQYRKAVLELNKDPVAFLEDVRQRNAAYSLILTHIDAHGQQIREPLRPMLNLYLEKAPDATETAASESASSASFVRPNLVPITAFELLEKSAPLRAAQYFASGTNTYSKEWASRGYTGHAGSYADIPLHELAPFMFDEHSIYEELPVHHRTLNERDRIFFSFFDHSMTDDHILEAADPILLEQARNACQSLPCFKLVPSVLYTNRLKDWFAPHRFEAFVPRSPDVAEIPITGDSNDASASGGVPTQSKPDPPQPIAPRQTPHAPAPARTPRLMDSSDSNSPLYVDSSYESYESDDPSEYSLSSSGELGITTRLAAAAPAPILGTQDLATVPPIPELQTGEVNEERVALLTTHFRRQLLDALEAICDALLPCLFDPQGQLSVKSAGRCLNISLTNAPFIVNAGTTVNIDPLLSLLDIFIPGSIHSLDPYSLDRVKFIPWVPVSLYWKWLGCMARLALIIPHPLQVLCGKFTYILMKLDVENDMDLLSSMGEPMMLAIATFGPMSALPNINPHAPRLSSSKSKDPQDDFKSKNDSNQSRSEQFLQDEPTDPFELPPPPPSSSFYFEDASSLPSYLIYYLHRFLDVIERARIQIPAWNHPTVLCSNGTYRRLAETIPSLIRGYESHCFQLAQFVLNQFHWQPKQLIPAHDAWAYLHQDWGNVVAAVVRDTSDVQRFLGLYSFRVPQSLHKKYGRRRSAIEMLTTVASYNLPSGRTPIITFLHALRHMTDEQVTQNYELLHAVFEPLQRVVGSAAKSTKWQVAALPLFPALLTTAEGVTVSNIRGAFTFPLRAPLLYFAAVATHPRIPPSVGNGWMNNTLTYLPPPSLVETVTFGVILQDLQRSNSTALRSRLGAESYHPRYDDTTSTPLEASTRQLSGYNEDLTLTNLIAAFCVFMAWNPTLTLPDVQDKKKLWEWFGAKLHFDIPSHGLYDKAILALIPTLNSQIQQGFSELQASAMKSNGSIWKIPNIGAFPTSITSQLRINSQHTSSQYGVVVVDRVVTVWLEDRGISLPSKASRAKKTNVTESQPGSQSSQLDPFVSSLLFWTMPIAQTPSSNITPSSFCRIGYASKKALEELAMNPLRSLGDVPESWAVDDWQSMILSEGSAWASTGEGVDCDYRLFNSHIPAVLSYDSFRNSICVESFLRTTCLTQEAPTQLWIPLPANRENLTIYPCFSFYHTRRFSVEPIKHPAP
jgi:hypothetical protein